MYILGINAYHGDTSATLLKDGQIVAAVEEERFNRIKHTSAFPVNAIRFCLEKAGIEVYDLDHIAIPRKPSANLWPKIRFTLSHRSDFNKVKDGLIRAGKARNIREILAQVLGIESSEFKAQFHHVEHHLAHCASAFFVSGFENAAVLSVDGFGDFLSTMFVDGNGTEM